MLCPHRCATMPPMHKKVPRGSLANLRGPSGLAESVIDSALESVEASGTVTAELVDFRWSRARADKDDDAGDGGEDYADREGKQCQGSPIQAASRAMSLASPRPMPSRRRMRK
jgi:hypothetical protein